MGTGEGMRRELALADAWQPCYRASELAHRFDLERGEPCIRIDRAGQAAPSPAACCSSKCRRISGCFGAIDAALGYWRRHTRWQVTKILITAGFELVLTPRYLYALAMPGWWWFGKVRKLCVVPELTVRLANALLWLSQLTERGLPLPAGLALVTVRRVHDRA